MLETVKHSDRIFGDVVSAGAVLGTIAGFLPAIAALGAVVWYAIQIWESNTVQKLRREKNE